MNELHFLIHNLSDLAPNHDRRPHCRVVDLLVENWAGGQYITYNYREHIKRIRRRPETAVVKNRDKRAPPFRTADKKAKCTYFWLPRTDFYLLPQFCDHGIVRFVIAIT